MPIRIQNNLPARQILEQENIFVMDEERALHQDIRPIQILLLNLMPTKEETELQILRCLSNSPLQVDVTFMMVSTHESKNTSKSHLNRFYVYYDTIKNIHFDGMIITGAPIEFFDFEDVDFWEEFVKILKWSETHVTSVMFQCWAAQAAMYYYHGINKKLMDKKIFGIFNHKVIHRKTPLVRGFDDEFFAPHSRHTEIPIDEVRKCDDIIILAESDEAGFFLGMAEDGKRIYIQGHPEYDRLTLDAEYKRDIAKGLEIDVPTNYYKDDNPENKPLMLWRSHSINFYNNWLNYYVYQTTPYNLLRTPEVFQDTYHQE